MEQNTITITADQYKKLSDLVKNLYTVDGLPSLSTAPYGDGAEDYCSPYDRFGGNFDDTYEGGYNDGENDMAYAVWEILFKDRL